MITIPIVNESDFPLPKFETILSSGMDLRAFIKTPITIGTLEKTIIKTGIKIELPSGFEGQIRPRSGLAYKHGITVLNSPGTIDPDYRGDISVIIINLSKKDYTISPGDRIAQIVISSYEKVNWELKNELSDSSRGDKGFGSTGNQ
jgi:dUTP pyrophosphatase